METLRYALRKLVYSIPLLFGVMLISFLLMVYFGPEQTFSILGKNATPQQIAEVRHQLGYDQSFFIRFFMFIIEY